VQRVAWTPPNDLLAGQGGGTLARLLDPARWGQIAAGFGTRMVSVKPWAYVLPVVLAPLVVPRPGGAVGPGHRPMVVAVALVAAGYALVYAVTPQDLAWHLRSSCERLIAHLAPTVVLAATLRWAPRRDPLPIGGPP
jgi:hypothetical protein